MFQLLIAVIVLGLLAWIVQTMLPEPFRKVGIVVLVIILVIYLLRFAGML